MMKHSNNLKPKPTVATYFKSLNTDQFERNLNVHMFTEDIHLAVMPIGGRSSSKNKFSISLKGTNSECERARKLIDHIAKYESHDVTQNVCKAIEEIAKQLSWEGCAVYEIIPSDADVPYIYSFTSKNLVKLFGWFLQIIPRGDWEFWNKKWVLIPSKNIWRIEMPAILGGRKGYLNIIKKLKSIDVLGPAFFRKNLENDIQPKYFDFQRYNWNGEIYRGKVTRVWGWNRRDWSQNKSTEFFCFYKMVNFHLAQAVLREHIVTEVNALLCRLGIDCNLVVNGLPSISELEEIKHNLLIGDLSFAAVSDKISIA